MPADVCPAGTQGTECCELIGAVGEGCAWTREYSCPGHPIAGAKGSAKDDGSDGFKCCCEIAFLIPTPPPPPPFPPASPFSRPPISPGVLDIYGHEGKLWVNGEPLAIKGINWFGSEVGRLRLPRTYATSHVCCMPGRRPIPAALMIRLHQHRAARRIVRVLLWALMCTRLLGI